MLPPLYPQITASGLYPYICECVYSPDILLMSGLYQAFSWVKSTQGLTTKWLRFIEPRETPHFSYYKSYNFAVSVSLSIPAHYNLPYLFLSLVSVKALLSISFTLFPSVFFNWTTVCAAAFQLLLALSTNQCILMMNRHTAWLPNYLSEKRVKPCSIYVMFCTLKYYILCLCWKCLSWIRCNSLP